MAVAFSQLLKASCALHHTAIAFCSISVFNRLTPYDPYMGRTAHLTYKRCILYIYSTNIGTEYFKLRFFIFKMQFVS